MKYQEPNATSLKQSWRSQFYPIAKLIEISTFLVAKLTNWFAWRFIEIASLPAQVAGSFSNNAFIEKNILYPQYQKAQRKHENKLPTLDSTDCKIVDELERTGICVTSLESLGISDTLEFFETAKKISKSLIKSSSLPKNKGKHEIHATSNQLVKNVELFHWGLNERLLNIIETYLGLPVAYDGLLFILSIADGTEKGARAWHRDREDRRMVKVCVYLNDVDDDGGPFECLQPESSSLLWNSVKQTYKSIFQEELNKFFPNQASEQVTTVAGSVGTVIFVDTARCYHRGKPPTKLNRSAIFFSYFSRRPWHPFFCQRSPFSNKDIDLLTQGISCDRQACVRWKDYLPQVVRWIPKSRI